MQLYPDESLSAGIKRIALELNANATTALKNALGEEHEAIHTVRKNLKEMRALLRLAKGAMEKVTFTFENLFYRNSGREISAIRDATSIIEALDKLKELFKEGIADDAYFKLKEGLIRKRNNLADDLLVSGHILSRLQEKLDQGGDRIAGWQIPGQGFEVVKPGFRKIYEQGYTLMRKAEKESVSANLHEWRKQAKYLMYHTRMFAPLWPELLIPLELEINLLTDHLGDDHDLSLLEHEIRPVLENGQQGRLFETLIHSRRKKLQQLAFLLGRKIYALDPYACADQMETWWGSWMEKETSSYTMVSGK